jgi:hypothetical protein
MPSPLLALEDHFATRLPNDVTQVRTQVGTKGVRRTRPTATSVMYHPPLRYALSKSVHPPECPSEWGFKEFNPWDS